MVIETTQNEREEKDWKTEQIISELWENFEWSKIYITGFARGGKKENKNIWREDNC